MSGLSFLRGKSSRRSPSTTHKAKKAKDVDEWKHSGLPNGAKNFLRKAREHMGTSRCPCRSADIKAMMEDCRAGRYGPEPWGAIIKVRVGAMLADSQTNMIWKAFTEDENGGLDTASTPWQIAVAWSVLGDIFVMFWAIKQGATQLSTVAMDLDAMYNAVTVSDPSDAIPMWDGKAFANGAPSPASKLVKNEVDAAFARAAVKPPTEVVNQGHVTPRDVGHVPRLRPRTFVLRCNYCWVTRKVQDTTHGADKCPHNPYKK